MRSKWVDIVGIEAIAIRERRVYTSVTHYYGYADVASSYRMSLISVLNKRWSDSVSPLARAEAEEETQVG
jgi:hypothetical protein